MATFDFEEQLRAYARWATLVDLGQGQWKFDQGSSLAGFDRWQATADPLNDDGPQAVFHKPSPRML